MWLVIRWIFLPSAVGRRIHLSIGDFNDRSKDFRKRRQSPWLGGPQLAPLAQILRLIVEFANQTMNSTANCPWVKNPSNNQPHCAK